MDRRYLLDTNVISELMRRVPARSVAEFVAAADHSGLYVSDITLAELKFGAELVQDAARQQGIIDALDERVRPLFPGRVLAADEETWLRWKHLDRKARQRRYTFPQPDLVIACLAIQHGLTVVTRDVEPFREAGAAFFNPWIS
jgi:toxin FitB